MLAHSCKTFLALVLALCLATAATAAKPSGGNSANSIAGVWQISGSSPAIPPFVNIATVSADGTMVNADPLLGAGAGQTYRIKGDEYALTFYTPTFFFGPPAKVAVYATGTLVAPDTLSGEFRTVVTSLADGTVLFTYEGTVEGVRLEVKGK